MPRLTELVDRLQTFYGLLPSPPRDPFILFVWEVLSVRSTPRKCDAALGALKRLRALTPDALWRAPQKTLEASVALAGPYLESRLRALRTGADAFRRNASLAATLRGPIVSARRALKALPQMGDGGASRMLLFAADHRVMPVDARIRRVATRLGYVRGGSGNRGQSGDCGPRGDRGDRGEARTIRAVRLTIERELPHEIDAYRRTFLYLDHHGAATCTEGDPHCGVCPLLDVCPDGQRRTRHRDPRLTVRD